MKQENIFLLKITNIFCFSLHEKQIINELLINGTLDWSFISHFFRVHRVGPAAYYKLEKYGLLSYLPTEICETIFTDYQMSCKNYQQYWKEIHAILSFSDTKESYELQNSYLLLKGEILARIFYPDNGTRPFGDCDILYTKVSLDQWCNRLKQLGYTQGYGEDGEIKPISRKEQLFSRLYMKHIISYVKYENNKLFVIEPHYTIFWKNLEGQPAFDLPMDVLFEHSMEITSDGIDIYCLENEYFLMYICLDIYEDANRIEKIANGTDLELIRFLDIYAVIHKGVDWNKFISIVVGYGMQKYIFYTLNAFASLYPILPSYILNILKPKSLSYLDEFGFPEEMNGEVKGKYDKPFIDRFFDGYYRISAYQKQKYKFKSTTFQKLKLGGNTDEIV